MCSKCLNAETSVAPVPVVWKYANCQNTVHCLLAMRNGDTLNIVGAQDQFLIPYSDCGQVWRWGRSYFCRTDDKAAKVGRDKMDKIRRRKVKNWVKMAKNRCSSTSTMAMAMELGQWRHWPSVDLKWWRIKSKTSIPHSGYGDQGLLWCEMWEMPQFGQINTSYAERLFWLSHWSFQVTWYSHWEPSDISC